MPTTSVSVIARPLVERELDGLLLNAEQVNAAMGSRAMAVINTEATMADDSATMAPPECLAL